MKLEYSDSYCTLYGTFIWKDDVNVIWGLVSGRCCFHVSSKHLQQIYGDLTAWRSWVIQIKDSIPLVNAFNAFVTAAFIMFLRWCKRRCGFIFIHTSAFHVCIGMNTNWNWRNEVNQPNNYGVLQTCQVFMVLSMQCW